MTGSILERIKAYKLDEVAARKAQVPPAEMEARARDAGPVRGFAEALHMAAASGYALIGEIKKASPSRGLIRPEFDPPGLARASARAPRPEPDRQPCSRFARIQLAGQRRPDAAPDSPGAAQPA